MRRRTTALAILAVLVLAVIPLVSMGGHGIQRAAAQASNPTSTATPATTVTVAPSGVTSGGSLTVVAENLPVVSTGLNADQFCAYLVDGAGTVTPLARVPTPNNTGVPPDPSLTPTAVPTTGIGSFIVPEGLAAGSYVVQINVCSVGLTYTSTTPIVGQSGVVTIGSSSTTAPAVTVPGFDVSHPEPIGTSFTVSVSNITGAACAFIAPVDVFDGISITNGVAVPAGASSFSMTIPSTYPSGLYQIFITSAASNGSCPTTQLAATGILASTPVVAVAAHVASLTLASSTAPMSAGSTVTITVSLVSGVSPTDVCISAFVGGQYGGQVVTVPAGAFINGVATGSYTLPAAAHGTATITATMGDCPTIATPAGTATPTPTVGTPSTPAATPTAIPAPAPTTFDAYTTIVIASAPAVSSTPTGTPPTPTATSSLGPPPPPVLGTATATATSTPLPVTPTMTATATTPPTATSTPKPKVFRFKFKYIRVKHFHIREGKVQGLRVQAVPHTGYGIWVHVAYPHGPRFNSYQDTNRKGFWRRTFRVPAHALSGSSTKAYVIVRLWHGRKHHDAHRYFFVSR